MDAQSNQPIFERAVSLVEQYNRKLSEYNVKCSVSKKYFETKTGHRTSNTGAGIFNILDHYLNSKNEKKYKNRPNSYHCIILTVLQCSKEILKKEYCRDYGFLLKIVERPHKGIAPMETVTNDDKVLTKIEKRLNKILSKAKKSPVQKVCKDTFADVTFRYMSNKYGYKNTILGKDKSRWDILLAILVGILFLGIVLVAWVITH